MGSRLAKPRCPRHYRSPWPDWDDYFVVYEDSIRALIPLRFTKNLGATVITLRIEYQACTPTMCFPPATLRVDLTLNGLDLIRD